MTFSSTGSCATTALTGLEEHLQRRKAGFEPAAWELPRSTTELLAHVDVPAPDVGIEPTAPALQRRCSTNVS